MNTVSPYKLLTTAEVVALKYPPYCFLLEQFKEVEHLLSERKKFGWRLSSAEYALLYTHVPYALHVTEQEDMLCAVSRRFKPIGTLISRPSRRCDAPYGPASSPWHIPRSLVQRALGPAYEVQDCNRSVYLFDDECIPWERKSGRDKYLGKLRNLIAALEGKSE